MFFQGLRHQRVTSSPLKDQNISLLGCEMRRRHVVWKWNKATGISAYPYGRKNPARITQPDDQERL